MSGGFFRGTSAEQDTRFSNKQAKLLKSQKFAPELDHLVDMSKVKMDVVRPWIAKRVTELLGFEDEVLINFIYGLLDGKDVNGKAIQIQLTGFMEKNTGKFMKELWALLLSAQKNVSGVPQQFLDAKEEETRKMKTEADRITLEIQKKKEKEKEGRELEQEKFKKLDGEGDISRSTNAASNSTLKHSLPRDSIDHPEDEKKADKRNGSRGKSRVFISSHPADSSPSSHRSTPSRSVSKPFSNSRSYSDERHKSRSISGSPKSRRRSVSPERPYNSPQRRSISPLRRHSPRRPRSPLRRGSPYSRRRSRSYSQHRSPSPARRRLPSPSRRRSPSPMRRRRSASPVRRQRSSPLRRSPSPARRRSPPPIHRRSPSPTRRRSPSPVRRRSPLTARRRSPIPSPGSPPYRRRSPSPPWRRSRSPVRRRSPKHRRRSRVQSPRQRFRSRSPYRSRSPAYRSHKSLRRDHDIRTNGMESKRYRDDYAFPRTSNRVRGKISPANNSTESEEVEHSGQTHTERDSMSRRPPISLRSPQRDPRDLNNTLQKVVALSPSPEKSPSSSESSPHTRKTIPSEDRKRSSMHDSPVRQRRERTTYGGSAGSPQRIREQTTDRGNPEASGDEEDINRARTVSSPKRFRLSPTVSNRKNSPAKDYYKEYPSKRLTSHLPNEAQGPQNNEPKKEDRDRKSEKVIARMVHPESLTQQKSPLLDESHYSPERPKGEIFSEDYVCNERLSAKKHDRDYSSSGERLKRSCPGSSHKAEKGKHLHSLSVEDSDWSQRKEAAKKLMKQADHNKKSHSFESGSEESDEYKNEVMEKRKHRRSDRHEVISDDDGSYDSQINEKKEAKRRRKEEKRLRKEEKRRRREERRRRKEERRARKLKLKSNDIETPPSDFEKNPDSVYNSDGELVVKKPSHPSDTEEIECEQKKLEIELRKKALESLRAKKGIGH